MTKKPAPPTARYVYVLVRTDLPFPHQVVQASHAVLAATHAYGNPNVTHPHLVVCGISSEEALVDIFENLKEQGVPCVAYYEDDLNNALTAVATGLLHGDQRQPLRRFPLLK